MGREKVAILAVIVVKNFSVDIAHLRGHGGHGFDHEPRFFVIELSDWLAFFGGEDNFVAIVGLDGLRAGRFGLHVKLLPVERSVEGALAHRVGPFGALFDTRTLESRVLPRYIAIA